MEEIDINKYEPIVEPVEDKAYRVLMAIAGSVPVASGAVTEIVNSFISSPLEVRRGEWLSALTNAVNYILSQLNKTENEVAQNKLLISAILRSSDIAIRTSDDEIHKVLIEGIISSAKNQSLDESRIAIYYSTIAKLTSLHLKLINYFSNLPVNDVDFDESYKITEKQELFFLKVAAYNIIFEDRDLVYRLMSDLNGDRIVALSDNSQRSLKGPNFIFMNLTGFGKELIDFIGLRETIENQHNNS